MSKVTQSLLFSHLPTYAQCQLKWFERADIAHHLICLFLASTLGHLQDTLLRFNRKHLSDRQLTTFTTHWPLTTAGLQWFGLFEMHSPRHHLHSCFQSTWLLLAVNWPTGQPDYWPTFRWAGLTWQFEPIYRAGHPFLSGRRGQCDTLTTFLVDRPVLTAGFLLRWATSVSNNTLTQGKTT